MLASVMILGLAIAGMATYPQRGPRVTLVYLTALETNVTVAKGDTRVMWTFNGTVPGPVVQVFQGDVVEFTLTNPASNHYSHSVDFHAAKVAWDKGYKVIPPGSVFTYRFEAKYPGVFMYHCGSSPVLQHITMGMYGMIVVHPNTPVPVAREYFIVQSEIYNIDLKNLANTTDDSFANASTVNPKYVVFNGYALKYLETPLQVKVGEKIRLYLLNAGPSLNSAFHVIGTIFDNVYIDGNPANLQRGLQTVDLPPSGGAIVEFSFDESGNNPFVTHSFAYASRGALGLFNVTGQSVTGTPPPQLQATKVHIVSGAISKTIDAYSPNPLIVKVGVNNTIVWVNDDAAAHTATTDSRVSGQDPATFDTGNINPGGQSNPITLDKAGTYHYTCLYHPGMVGTIVVLPPDSHS